MCTPRGLTLASNARIRLSARQADHGFADGTASYRDRFRESPFDTAFFFLQNAAGAARWEVTDEVEEEIRRAMWRAVRAAASRLRCAFRLLLGR